VALVFVSLFAWLLPRQEPLFNFQLDSGYPLVLASAAQLSTEVKLLAPAGYMPGIAYLARVEVRNASGERDWTLWDAEAFLSTDRPGVALSTNRITLRNGLGTALLTITGSADFTLTATVNGQQTAQSVSSLGGQALIAVSGELPGTSTTWRGVVNVTGTVTVPSGHTLTIQPDTLVLINGVATGTSGIGLNVNGTIQSLGTESNPVTITCENPNLNWGQIRHNNAQPSVYQHPAGRAQGEGHTGTGPAIRPSDSTITLDSCVISDLTANDSTVGKIMQASGSTLAIRNCVFTRARMEPEIAGTSLACTNSYFMEMSGPDDSDGIYLHSAAGRSLTLSGCVLASGADDAIDTLDSNVTIENCIIRDWPNPNEDAKGVIAFNGEVQLRRCLIANCFAGVSGKSSGPLAVLRVDHCTIAGIDKGVAAATKSNASAGNINIYLSNSIVRSADAIHSDFGPEKFVSVTYCNLSETWLGAGNITDDPLFMNISGGDYRLKPGSPCINAGDPAFPVDPDGSPTDIGMFTAAPNSAAFFVAITSPVPGAIFIAPTNITIAATANSTDASLSEVKFFEGASHLGNDVSAPYSFAWNNVRAGNYTLRAVAIQTGGLMTTSAPVNISVSTGEAPSTNVLVAAGSDWRYLDAGTDQGTAWTQLSFNDSSWKTGQAQLGCGYGDEATTLSFGPSANNKFITYYFRRTFVLADPARVQSLRMNLLRDDGAIIYLNGREAHRVAMPTGTVKFRTLATAGSDYNWEPSTLDKSLLTAGTNIVAVEMHQGSANSSDVRFDLELSAVLAAPGNSRPIVIVTAPANNAIFGAPAKIVMSANAIDADGSVKTVAFFANGAKLGEDASNPFEFVWNDVPPGSYAISAVATDETSLSGSSSTVNIIVSANAGPPTVVSQSPLPGPVTSLREVTITFSKAMAGVNAADLLLNGVPATEVNGAGDTFTFVFTPTSPGGAAISWSPAHGITDTFTPPNPFNHTAPGTTWQYQFSDAAPPAVQSLSPPANSTVAALTNIVISFDESVAGVRASDLLINSKPASSVSGSGAGPYTFVFPQPPEGTVAVSWAGSNSIRDQANNPFGGGAWSYLLDPDQAGIVINEIMYHPSSENPLEEYIELFNRSASPVNLQAWRLRDAVEFAFPIVTVPPNGYLVVAADLTAFRAKYPGVNNVVGNWTGMLSNSREDIDLDDAQGNRVDSVRCADEGDWAIRRRGPLELQHRGWVWFAEHDGLGKSAELINASMSNNNGQNWASSAIQNGTPGRANSVIANNIAPLIENAAHFPVVPKSSETVRVTAKVSDEAQGEVVVTLRHRVNSATPPNFSAATMRDDGLNGDISANDGIVSAILPAQASNSVVEFYIHAVDALGSARTWPAPAIAAADGAGPTGQVVNALYQVDDTAYAGRQPLYKIIMTENERAELAIIPSQSSGEGPNSQMNATFISFDGTGTDLRYLTGVRNRGHGSRRANPPNYRVNFRADEPWKGVVAINLNSQQVHMQHFGSWLANKSGAIGTYSQAVQVRINNANQANAGGGMFGSYAANEVYDAGWPDRHFPTDSEGNIYKVIRDIRPPNFDYRGANKNSYANTYFKETNVSEDDWSDLIAMLQVMGENSGAQFTAENVRKVINVEQWLTHLAVMNLMANGESGLNTGNNDDYYMYRGNADRRFLLLYHDLDQILGQGSLAQNVELFRATCCPISGDAEGAWRAMNRFLHSPDFEPLYYATLRRLIETTFSKPHFDALIDQVLGSYVPQPTINAVKTWMDGRRSFVQSQLPPKTVAVTTPIATISGGPRSPTPQNAATLSIGGTGITHYRLRLNNGAYGPETPVNSAMPIIRLEIGTNIVAVIGKNSAGVWQTESKATVRAWIVDPAWPAARINEVLAGNAAAVSRNGLYPDLVELYNEGGSPVNLSGMRLTDNPDAPNKFTFANGTVLAPGGYLVLDANQLGFGLDQTGDGVYLFNSASTGSALLDSVEFGAQVPDFSLGRVDSGGDWVLTQPTFGAANAVQQLGDPKQVKINEWLTLGLSPYPDDFIELYNPQPLPVALGGSYLTDQPSGAPTRSRVAPVTFISANGYVLFVSGDADSPHEFNFNLSTEQGEIALLAPDLSLIDSVVYSGQQLGTSTGRCADGESSIKALGSPTPGGPNQCPFVPPPSQTVTLVPFNHLWKYNATGTDLGAAWRETNYDDSPWRSGPGLLGIENNPLPQPLLTTLPTPTNSTYYFRAQFNVTEGLTASSIQVTHLVDDGAAFYLNGREVSRFNLRAGADFGTFAAANLGDATLQTFTLPVEQLRSGANFLAVEVHQINRTSSDIVFGLKIDALIATNSAAQSGLVINEVLANNASLADTDGSRPDWVELYNPSNDRVNLAGMSLTDDVAAPRRWSFPIGSSIAAKGFLRVRFNSDAPASDSNTGLGLKANGGSVHLFNRAADGGRLLSSVTYGLQAPNWSIGRVPDGGTNWVLTNPTFGGANTAAALANPPSLRINEWMADPATGEDWFEVFNPNAQPVEMSRFWLSDNLSSPMKHALPPLSFIGTGSHAFQRFEADQNLEAGADHVNFRLTGSGEALAISSVNGALIDGITFGPQVIGVSQGRFPDGATRLANFPATPSPGSGNFRPLDNVVINELLSHSDLPLEDAVEFHNPSASAVNIGGWFLSDTPASLRKYRIPDNTIIPAGGYLALYEFQFNRSETASEPFSFSSAKGDEVYLSQTINGELTGYRASAAFDASENGVSFGRVLTSQGFHFVPMARRTFGQDNPSAVDQFRFGTGAPNSSAKVGPIVISEIMCRSPNADDALEFVELHNPSALSVPLYDPANPANTWRLRKGIEFDFPQGAVIPAAGRLVVVSFDPRSDAVVAFQNMYGTGASLAGPYRGKLRDSGDTLVLQKPDAPQTLPGPDFGLVPYVTIDRIDYSDVAPWPAAADGAGLSLQRISVSTYGNDPVNWTASTPNPGAGTTIVGDSDSDGLPNDWEIAHGLNPNDNGDAASDPDQDRANNLQEYLAGTNPRNATSVFRAGLQLNSSGLLTFEFTAAANKAYSIEFRDSLESGSWQKLTDIASAPSERGLQLPINVTGSMRFYRIVVLSPP